MRIVYLILIPMFFSCFRVSRECSDFKTGKFTYKEIINNKLEIMEFYRNDSIEITKFNNNIDTAIIRWINPCEYILRTLNPKNIKEKKAIRFKIVSTHKDSCVVHYNLVGSNNIRKGTLIKVINNTN